MSKYLEKPCVDIRITTLQVSRKKVDDDIGWQTYAIVSGEAIDEDGTALQKISAKIKIGMPGPDDWDADSFEVDITAVASQVKAKYNQVLANYTTT